MQLQKKPKAVVFIGYEGKDESIWAAKEQEYKTILITEDFVNPPEDLFNEIHLIDIRNRIDVDETITKLKSVYAVKGVISNYEKFVVQRSYIAECFGLPTTSVYSACCSRNKVMQRHALGFMKENIPYRIVKSEKEAVSAVKRFKENAFLKVISGIRSENIYHLKSLEELNEVFSGFSEKSLKITNVLNTDFKFFNFRFHYPDPRKFFLIEKAISGTQITVASFANSHLVSHAPSIVDVYTAKDIGVDDSFLAFRILPSKHTKEIRRKAKDIAETAIRVLGLQCCAVHTELIMDESGQIWIVEIASRIGGFRSLMYKKAFDLDIAKYTVQSAVNKKSSIKSRAKKYVSMISIFPKKQGVLKGFNKDLVLQDKAVSDFVLRCNIGDEVGPAKKGFRSVATFLISGKTYDEVYLKSLKFQEMELVEVE